MKIASPQRSVLFTPLFAVIAISGFTLANLASAQTNCATAPSGLVSWWRGQGTALDAAGTNNGTLVGNTGYGPGRVGQGLLLDGDADAVTLGNPVSLRLQDFTIETWIRRTSVFLVSFSGNGVGQLFAYGQNGYGLYLDPFGTPALTKVGISDVKPGASITDTNLHHLAVTKSGNTVVFYVDGTAYPAASYNPGFTFTTLAAIGARGDNSDNSFYGLIDEMSVYNRALTTNEIQAIYNAGADGKCLTPPTIQTQPQDATVLVGQDATFNVTATGTPLLSYQWKFNNTDLAGATGASLIVTNAQLTNAGNYSVAMTNDAGFAISSNAVLTVSTSPPCSTPVAGLVGWWRGETNGLDSARTNNGTLAGNTTYGLGRVAQGFVFDGTNDAVQLANQASLQLQDLTIEAWIRRSSASAVSFSANGIGQLFAYGQNGYGFYLDPTGVPTLTKVGVTDVKPSVTITDTNFHHVAVTKSGSTVVFYVDGTAYTASAYNPGFTFTTSVAIGARGDNLDNSFYGVIDEVSVYNRALASGEIQAIYSANASGKCLIPPTIAVQPQSQTNLVGQTATFNVTAVGAQPLSYQWSFNGTNIAGATATTLMLGNVQLTNAGIYSVLVSNSAGTLVSSNAVLTVLTSPPCATPVTGLVGWWRAEGNALDSVGTNNGTLSGNTTYGPARVGQGFVFNGTGAVVNLGNPTNLQIQDLTVETWIRRASTSAASLNGNGNGHIFSYGNGGYGLYMDQNGVPTLSKVGVDQVKPSVAITDTNLHHVAVTKSGSAVVFYVDGVAYSAAAYNPGFSFSANLYIGGLDNNYSFYGVVDEASVYNRALTMIEVQAIYNAGTQGKCLIPPTIVLHPQSQTVFTGQTVNFVSIATGSQPISYQWRLNGTNVVGATNSSLTLTNIQLTSAGTYSVFASNSVSTAISSNAVLIVNVAPPCAPPPSGLVGWWRGEGNALDEVSANNGTLSGNVTYGSGRVGQAFVCDGNNDLVTVGNPASFRLQTFTIEAWIKRSSPSTVSSGSYGIAEIFGYGQGGYGLLMLPDGHVGLSLIGTDSATAGPAITDTLFHHVAVTKTGSVVTVFIDGVAYSASAYNPTFSFSTVAAIGARGDNLDNSFMGAIDEVALYNRALATNEIQAIYSAGVSGKCIVPFAPFIISHPTNRTVTVGGTANFNVTAGGTTPSYQWRFNGTNIAGATSTTLTLSNVQLNQAGSYSVEVTNSAGKATSSNATLTVTFPTAVVRAGATNVISGRPVTVPVTLAANGNENGLGFSLNFNTQRLAFASASLGSGAGGAVLFVNTSMTTTGRLGVAIAYPPQMSFTSGTQEVVRINFNTLPLLGVSSVNATNSFADQPVLRELFDPQLQALPVNFSNGIVTLNPTVFEGDVFPRPNGNQTVAASDWSQAGRFAARLDTAATGAEFQRADVAPRATLGDGQMKATDWVQVGRYLAGLDVLAALGGPTNETIVSSGSSPVSRQLRLSSTNVLQTQSAKVSVLLDAQGDENAIGFTLEFDASAFALADVNLGGGAPGANLIANTSQAGAGRVGLVLALPAGTTFDAGSAELVQVNLVASPDVVGPFPISLTDQMVTRCASDALAAELPVNYADGVLTVKPINPNPTLQIAQSDTNVVLSWPLWAADFTLQTLTGTNGVQGTWSNTSVTLQTNGSTVFVNLPIAAESKYFRLFHP